MSNEQRSVTSFQKRGLLFKEKISVYFFVNEQVLNLINPKGRREASALAYTSLSIVQCSLFTDKQDERSINKIENENEESKTTFLILFYSQLTSGRFNPMAQET
jgi:hypothetical protein